MLRPHPAYLQRVQSLIHTFIHEGSRHSWTRQEAAFSLLALSSITLLRHASLDEREIARLDNQIIDPLMMQFTRCPSQDERAAFLNHVLFFVMGQATQTHDSNALQWPHATFQQSFAVSKDEVQVFLRTHQITHTFAPLLERIATFLTQQGTTTYDVISLTSVLNAVLANPHLEEAPAGHGHTRLDYMALMTNQPAVLGLFYRRLVQAALTPSETVDTSLFTADEAERAPVQQESVATEKPLVDFAIGLPAAPLTATFPGAATWNQIVEQAMEAFRHLQFERADHLLAQASELSRVWPATEPQGVLTDLCALLVSSHASRTGVDPEVWSRLEARLRLVRAFHPIDALSGLILGLVQELRSCQRYEDTLSILRTWFTTCERTVGRLHLHTLMALHELTETLVDLYRFTDAYPLTQDLLQRRQEVHGPSHLETLRVLNNLGSQATYLHRHDEAEQALRLALEHAALVPDSQSLRAAAMSNLACLHVARHEWDAAIACYEQLLDETSELSGSRAIERLPFLTNLGNAYLIKGHIGQAAPFLEQAYILALTHGRLKTLEGIIIASHWTIVLHGLQRYQDATPIIEDAVALAGVILGPHHEETIQATINLAINRHHRERRDESEQILTGLVEQLETHLTVSSATLRTVYLVLLEFYQHAGRAREALSLEQKLRDLDDVSEH